MPALFRPWSNTAYGLALASAVCGVGAAIAAPMIYIRTPYGTHQYEALEQPVEFDHRHHIRDDGIGCLYCHTDAANGRYAGIPSTGVCMGCHNQIWTRSELLAGVRSSYFGQAPIVWKRIHDLPDFVYFHHGVHVQRGIGCARCHGEVEEMARVYRISPLTMDWCLDCHRHPPGSNQPAFGGPITSLTTCTACHR
jgi:hypothetical protein